MVVSAFKSTSKRGTVASPSSAHSSSSRDRPPAESGRKVPLRRSRSVSAARRSAGARAPSDVSEFENTRDNPLYGCSSSSTSPASENRSGSVKSEDLGARRAGRSVSRGSGIGVGRSDSGRSLSRVDARRRSASRGHYGTRENEADNASKSSFSTRKNQSVGVSGTTKRLQSVNSEQLQSEKWDTSSARQWEDITSTGSFSEAEEATILEFLQSDNISGDVEAGGIYETVRSEIRRAVSEIKNDLENVILWKNPVTAESIADDAPLELVNPEATELVSDMRREYATKLEQSQERARKLRADLAVEQQRKQELSRILKEILPDPKTPETHKSRPKRKASIERLKMSRRLTEEAMNYFDECVSISTFDGSDFSSQEDQQPANGVDMIRTGSSRFLSDEVSNFMASGYSSDLCCHHEEMEHHTQHSLCIAGADLASRSTCSSKTAEAINENGSSENLADSDTLHSGYSGFRVRSSESRGFHDIGHYINKFGKGSRDEESENFKRKSSYIADDYDLSSSLENLLFDRVTFRNRIDSGGLLLCDIRNF